MNGGFVPALPSIQLATLDGLTLREVPGATITAADIASNREHRFCLENRSDVELMDLDAHVQFPEPLLSWRSVDCPAGIFVNWQPIRMELQALIKGGGSATRHGPPAPINVFRLQIDRVPSRRRVETALLSSLSEFQVQAILDSTPGGIEDAKQIKNFVNGHFSFQYRGATLRRRFFAPIFYDAGGRKFTVGDVLSDFGPWQPIAQSIFS
jgi:hypothetical protein